MNLRTAHTYQHRDDDSFAAWMLDLIDESPDRLGLIRVPDVPDDQLDDIEDAVRRAYDIAKAQRPNLAIKVLPGAMMSPAGRGPTRVLVAVHEHSWVAGACANGCPERREVT
jgi:hypothetical protein